MSDNRAPSADISKFYNLTAYNNYMYAKQMGYDFKWLLPITKEDGLPAHINCKNPTTKGPRHAAWSKILSVYKELKNYDTVVYIDSDAYFNNKESVYSRSGYENVDAPIKFLMDIPWNRFANTGFMMVDNTKESFDFLRRWFFAKETSTQYDLEGIWDQYYVQTVEDKAFTVLNINQIKVCAADNDEIHDRWIINHVSGKISSNQYELIYDDVNKYYSFAWFNEVMHYIAQSSEKYFTEDVVNLMEGSEEQIKNYCASRVISGPFKGLYIDKSEHWWGGDICAKWLGTYEEPIHFAVSSELRKNHDLFINVGCGDGYYGAGVGLKNPDSSIALFDIAVECERLIKNVFEKNGLADCLFSKESSAPNISALLAKAKNPWMLMDIEGAELDLLDPVEIPELNKTVIIVELHDFNRPGATTILLQRFKKTHYIVNIEDTLTRDIGDLPAWLVIDETIHKKIVTENRPVKMNWLYMIPKL